MGAPEPLVTLTNRNTVVTVYPRTTGLVRPPIFAVSDRAVEAETGQPPVSTDAPIFFLSYAHPAEDRRTGRGAQDSFVTFFEDLSTDVSQLVSLPAGSEAGYIYRSISRHWTPDLLEALGTCQVFVPLLSVRYFMSRWTAMEWGAFARRATQIKPGEAKSPVSTGIFPVVWAGPLPQARVPHAVAQIQRFTPASSPDPNIRQRYEREGIFGLLKTDPGSYRRVVWNLAQQIAKFHYTHRVEPITLKEDDLVDAFSDMRA